jgi:segregation and condensation protein A
MSRILKALGTGRFVEFSELFEPERGVAVLVVSFLALLELRRESLIELSQQSPFDPIYVKLKSERATLTIA